MFTGTEGDSTFNDVCVQATLGPGGEFETDLTVTLMGAADTASGLLLIVQYANSFHDSLVDVLVVECNSNKFIMLMFFSLAAADFSLTTSSVAFSGPPSPQCITIDLMNDFILEGDESFTVDIMSSGGANTKAPTSATVLIEDNDSKFVFL